MAERVPQNGRYFQFLRIALISTFFPFSLSLPSLSLSFFFSFLSIALSPSLALTLIPTFSLGTLFFFFSSSHATPRVHCPLPLPPLRRSLTYYWKAIVFSRRRFSYGAAIFHDPILERREHEACGAEGGRQG